MPQNRTEKVDQVKQRLLDRLRNGLYRAGDRFLSNRAVVEQFGISYQTAHRLIAELCAEGLLERRPQSGTYVAGGTVKPAGVQIVFHERAGQAWSFGSKLLALLQRKLDAERIDWKAELAAERADVPADRIPIVWELPAVTAACAAAERQAILINQRPASGFESLYVDSVSTDDFSGGAVAAQLLRDRAAKRRGFAVVAGPEDDARSRARQEGFQSIVHAAVVRAGSWFFDHGYRAAERALKVGKGGLFCVNDQLAAGVIAWAAEHGQPRPPIVGFDDAPIAERLNLTTISLPWDEMLEGVVRAVKRRLAGDRAATSHQMFHPRPIVRDLREIAPSAATA
jgi:DNA-binding transcriptional regulator YhcF (GntR family)